MHFERLEAKLDSAARAIPFEDPPDWKPLESLLGPALIGQFMYMGRSGAIRLYKHGMTRAYLNVDDHLRTYAYLGGNYGLIPLARALAAAFQDCEKLGARPEVAYDNQFRSDRDAALSAAGYRTVTVKPGEGVQDD